MNTPLVLDMAMCDWLTLTSFEDTLYKSFVDMMGGLTDFQTVRRMQYDGRQYGHIFIGTAEQSNKRHNMVQISGADADRFVGEWSNDDTVRCSRIDIQVTCASKKAIDMFALAERQKGKGRLVGFIESGGLATVYIGSWKSNSFLRIYQKSRNVIRLEACYKGSKANHLHMYIGQPGEIHAKMRSMLKSELNKLDDEVLESIFSHALYGDAAMPKMTARPETNTEKWFTQSVIPALTKYINSSDCDQQIVSLFLAALEMRNVNV